MKTKKILITLLMALFISHSSFSQVSSSQVELDEIVLSVPFSQTIGKSVIKVQKINLDNLNPILRSYVSKSLSKLPGVNIISNGPGISKPSIRGLSGNRVVLFSNGIRLENMQWGDEHGLGVSPSSISSIEVIKGPTYVLYGSDAMGGVLYIEPEKYSDDFSTDYLGIYNSNYNGITNSIGARGSSGEFNYLLRGTLTDNQNYSTPDGEIENTWFKENDVQAGLKYESEKFKSDLRFSLNYSEIGIPHMDEEHGGHDDHEEEGHDDDDDDHEEEGHDDHEDEEESYQELTHTTFAWKNTFDFGNNHILDVILGRQVNDRKEIGGHGEEEGHDDDDHEEEGHEEGEAELDMNQVTNTLDLRLVMPQSENLNIVMGANFLSQNIENFGHEELIPDSDMNDFGIYGLGQVSIKNGQALVGVRYDSRSINSDMGSADFSNFNGSIGIRKDYENSTLRLNLGSGYRAPNLVELFADGVHHGTNRYEIGSTNLNAEKSFQTDLSLDFNYDDSSFSVDLFYNDISDYIYLTPSSMMMDGYRVYNYIQQNSYLWGGEINYSKQTGIKWLVSNTSLEYTFAESEDGEALPFIPPLTFDQTFNLNFSSDYSLEINFIAKSKQSRVSMFEEETDGYSLLNLSGNWMTSLLGNDLNIFWSIDNVFDKEYYDHLSRLKTIGIPEMGRNISVGLKYNF